MTSETLTHSSSPAATEEAKPLLRITFWDSEQGYEVDLHEETLEALHNKLCRYGSGAPWSSIRVYDEAGFIVGWVSLGAWKSV